MNAEVISLASRKRDQMPAVTCGCCEHHTCYPHRVAQIAVDLRAALAVLPDEAGRTTNWLVLRSEVEAMAADALLQLDAITDECLTETRETR